MQIAEYNQMVPKRIEEIIEKKGYKKTHIAKLAGLSASEFSSMLNGRRIIKPCDVVTISKALGVSANELFKSD